LLDICLVSEPIKNYHEKKQPCYFLLHFTGFIFLYGQDQKSKMRRCKKKITSLIDQYSEAREKRDTLLLKTILTSDVDQLVSTGEWRVGINAAIEGMMKVLPIVREQEH